MGSKVHEERALDHAWTAIAKHRAPKDILELIIEYADASHDWTQASGFSIEAIFSRADMSRVVLPSAAGTFTPQGFVTGGFAFTNGRRYNIEISVAHVARNPRDKKPHIGLLEAKTISAAEHGAGASCTLSKLISENPALVKAYSVALTAARTSHIEISIDFSRGHHGRATFDINGNRNEEAQQVVFDVRAPCVLYARGASRGVSTIRIDSVKIW